MKNNGNIDYDKLWSAIMNVDTEFADELRDMGMGKECECECCECGMPGFVEFGFPDKPAVIFDDEAKTTTVTFPDGEIVTVKCGEKDTYSRSAGLAAAAAKYMFGTNAAIHRLLQDPETTVSGTEQKIRSLTRRAKKGNKTAKRELRELFPVMNRMLDDDDAGEHYKKLKEQAEEALGFYRKPDENDVTEMIMSSLDSEPPVEGKKNPAKKPRTRRKKAEPVETATA